MEKVQFMPEGEDQAVDFFVLEEAMLGGKQYLLVTCGSDDDEALILRAKPDENGTEITYEIVEDDREQTAVLLLMKDSLEELGIEIEV